MEAKLRWNTGYFVLDTDSFTGLMPVMDDRGRLLDGLQALFDLLASTPTHQWLDAILKEVKHIDPRLKPGARVRIYSVRDGHLYGYGTILKQQKKSDLFQVQLDNKDHIIVTFDRTYLEPIEIAPGDKVQISYNHDDPVLRGAIGIVESSDAVGHTWRVRIPENALSFYIPDRYLEVVE